MPTFMGQKVVKHHSQSQQQTLLCTYYQAMIHQRVLTFFGKISRLPESSVENQLADCQLAVKTLDSNSWFVAVRKLCIMYGLSDCVDLLDTPPPPKKKASWKRTVNRAECIYWAGRIQSFVPLYPSLKRLTFDLTEWPKRYSLL